MSEALGPVAERRGQPQPGTRRPAGTAGRPAGSPRRAAPPRRRARPPWPRPRRRSPGSMCRARTTPVSRRAGRCRQPQGADGAAVDADVVARLPGRLRRASGPLGRRVVVTWSSLPRFRGAPDHAPAAFRPGPCSAAERSAKIRMALAVTGPGRAGQLAAVDAVHGLHVPQGGGQEDLLGLVRGRRRAGRSRGAGPLDDECAGDAREAAGGDRRGEQLTVQDDEDVGAGALAEPAPRCWRTAPRWPPPGGRGPARRRSRRRRWSSARSARPRSLRVQGTVITAVVSGRGAASSRATTRVGRRRRGRSRAARGRRCR